MALTKIYKLGKKLGKWFAVSLDKDEADQELLGSPILKSTVTLTHDQIKILGSELVELVPSPGVNKAIIVTEVILYFKWVADYSAIQAGCGVVVIGPGGAMVVPIVEGVGNRVTQLFAHGKSSVSRMLPQGATAFTDPNINYSSEVFDFDSLENTALYIALFNNPDPLEDGHPDNTLKVITYYRIEEF